MKYFVFHNLYLIIFSEIGLILLICFMIFYSLRTIYKFMLSTEKEDNYLLKSQKLSKKSEIVRIISSIFLIIIIISNIVLYFISELSYAKYFAIFIILLSLDIIILSNSLYIVVDLKADNTSMESNIKQNNIFTKIFIKIIKNISTILLLLNAITFALIYSFKLFSFPINFFIVVLLAFFLFIVLFRFFEKYKNVNQESKKDEII